MKTWILENIGSIGAVFGVLILVSFLMSFKYFPEIRENKWFDLWFTGMYIIWIVGAGATFKTIFEWIVK